MLLTFQIQPKIYYIILLVKITPFEEQFVKIVARITTIIMLKKMASLNLIKADDIGMINFFKNRNFSL